MTTQNETQVRLFASSRSWIEGEALRQLNATARLPGVRRAAGFPDLHPGKGTPVGAAFVTRDILYPHVIGSDIGCGMALFQTNLVRRDARLDRWAKLRFDLEQPWEERAGDYLGERNIDSTEFDLALGTLGGGNHFAELQAVEQIFDSTAFKKVGVGREQLVVLVHSGSRGLGEAVFREHVAVHGAEGVGVNSEAAAEYWRGHNKALRWAKANREVIAGRFAGVLGADAAMLWDGCHNSIAMRETVDGKDWVHRKGAVSADDTFVVIPGSRGSLSYLLQPMSSDESHVWSVAHGAGRKWTRSEARVRMRERFGVQQLIQTPLGGRVICEERELLYEEAPAAYKNIEAVIGDLVDAGLVSVIATFRPLLTYKTRKLRR